MTDFPLTPAECEALSAAIHVHEMARLRKVNDDLKAALNAIKPT